MTKVMISCGEASGDLYAGALASEIIRLDKDVEVFGLGGAQLQAGGGRLVADYRDWRSPASLKRYRSCRARWRRTAASSPPRALAVPTCSWLWISGFQLSPGGRHASVGRAGRLLRESPGVGMATAPSQDDETPGRPSARHLSLRRTAVPRGGHSRRVRGSSARRSGTRARAAHGVSPAARPRSRRAHGRAATRQSPE